ncbi:MAG: hypothetical protein J6T48_12885 [Bacteroidales bacterium]|nr:hypothetical protein [Bacteroidales bacterium]
MKKNIFISLLVVAMGVMAFMGCEREQIVPNGGQSQQRTEDSLINQQSDTIVQPSQNVEFTAVEIELPRNIRDGVNWGISVYGHSVYCDDDSIYCTPIEVPYIINSQEDFETLLGRCHASLPILDFEKGSLVYTRYTPLMWPVRIITSLTRSDSLPDTYNLLIDICDGDLDGSEDYDVAYYVVPKLNGNEIINVIKNEYDYTGE